MHLLLVAKQAVLAAAFKEKALYNSSNSQSYVLVILHSTQHKSVFNSISNHITIFYENWVVWMKSKLYLESKL